MEKINAHIPKVVITGPESSGKTTLCEALAAHYGVPCVPEYARQYLQEHGPGYRQADLLTIARGQIRLEEATLARQPRLLLCDTSLEVIRIWWEWRYGPCPTWLLEQSRQRLPDLYLLLSPDIPWQPDPLRENPHDRQALFARYQNLLDEYQVPYVVVQGSMARRQKTAIETIDKMMEYPQE